MQSVDYVKGGRFPDPHRHIAAFLSVPPALHTRVSGYSATPQSAATPEWVRELRELTRSELALIHGRSSGGWLGPGGTFSARLIIRQCAVLTKSVFL
jgi:hypothetical protein